MSAKFISADIAKTIRDAGVERATAAGLAQAIVKAMADALIAGQVIELRGLGTFEQRRWKARIRHNPRTMAKVEVPDRRGIIFRPSKKLRRAINDKEAGM
jgi:nucleoid DNA-binding protein